MKFGEIKTIIENNFIDSVKDRKIFRENIQNFKKHFLKNPNLGKLYLVYGDLSKPRGLNEDEARKYLDEGIKWAKTLIKENKLPSIQNSLKENNYELIDSLVYDTSKTIEESLTIKNKILSSLQTKLKDETKVRLPISAMVKVSNEKIKEFLNSIDETTRKDIINLVSEDKKNLKENFVELKEEAVNKLSALIVAEVNPDLQNKLKETINKIENENFDVLNYYNLKRLNESLD